MTDETPVRSILTGMKHHEERWVHKELFGWFSSIFVVLLKTFGRVSWIIVSCLWEKALQMACGLEYLIGRKRDKKKTSRKQCEGFEKELTTCRARRYNDLEQRSKGNSLEMTRLLEKSGHLENINDEFSNMRLAKKFEELSNRQWVDASQWLYEAVPEMSELDRISFLKALMVKAYELCEDMAEKLLRKFLQLHEDDNLPTASENPEIYKRRRINGQEDSTRQNVKRTVCENVLAAEADDIGILKRGGATIVLSKFLEDFADCCWLMTVSQPRLILQFKVIDELHDGKLKERFTKYSCQDTVVDKTMVKGSIKEVVWPCIELEDGTGYFKKGEVIIVEDGKED